MSSGRDMVSFGGKMLITVELAYVFLMSSTLPFSVKPLDFKVGCSKKLEGRCDFCLLGGIWGVELQTCCHVYVYICSITFVRRIYAGRDLDLNGATQSRSPQLGLN